MNEESFLTAPARGRGRAYLRPAARLLARPVLLFGLISLGLTLISLASRGSVPIDETRYLAVAWEMWTRADFLVPYLNGEPYSHKPPLLFWLIQAGWYAGGVSEWWPRALPGLLSFINLLLIYRLARLLWPAAPWVARTAPLLTVTSLLWALFATAIMFDMLLTLCVLTGLLGIIHAAKRRRGGWPLLALAVGLGLLAKGPVILLHLLPPALLAPLWSPALGQNRGRWYLGMTWAVLGGALLALGWALPAAARGGAAYADAIFWGQTAHRVVNAFAHEQPFWWYLPLLPVLLFPWFLWPGLWRGLRASWRGPWDPGVRFVMTWVGSVFVAFSLVSGKQPQYLLPLVPGIMLLAARAIRRGPDSRERLLLPAFGLALAGLAGVVELFVLKPHLIAAPLAAAAGFAALVPVCVWLGGTRIRGRRRAVAALAGAVLAAFLVLHAGPIRGIWPAYDVSPVSTAIAAHRATGIPVAHIGGYEGEFHFAGRLTEPLETVTRAGVPDWAARHPNGRLIHDFAQLPADAPPPEAAYPFRSRLVGIWPAASLREESAARALFSAR